MRTVVAFSDTVGGTLYIGINDDGVTIASYGGLKRGLGLDDLLVGISSPRNPKLASVLYRLGFIESHGTGIPA